MRAGTYTTSLPTFIKTPMELLAHHLMYSNSISVNHRALKPELQSLHLTDEETEPLESRELSGSCASWWQSGILIMISCLLVDHPLCHTVLLMINFKDRTNSHQVSKSDFLTGLGDTHSARSPCRVRICTDSSRTPGVSSNLQPIIPRSHTYYSPPPPTQGSEVSSNLVLLCALVSHTKLELKDILDKVLLSPLRSASQWRKNTAEDTLLAIWSPSLWV